MTAARFRLMLSPPAPGARQMAYDEALLEACAADPHGFTPVLRLYAFEPPCLSIGRFQAITDVDLAACRRDGIDVVRRPTGGRAVLHARDLTYAVVAPEAGPVFAGGVRRSVERIGAVLLDAVRRLGITDAAIAERRVGVRAARRADCFASAGAYEVAVRGRKLAGSAQVRRNGAALQHGTLRLSDGAGDAGRYLRERAASVAVVREPEMVPASLSSVAGRAIGFDEAAITVVAAFSSVLGEKDSPGYLTPWEIARAAELEQRFAAPEWTARR